MKRKYLITAVLLLFVSSTSLITQADSSCPYGVCPPDTGIIRTKVEENQEYIKYLPILLVCVFIGILFALNGQLLKQKLKSF